MAVGAPPSPSARSSTGRTNRYPRFGTFTTSLALGGFVLSVATAGRMVEWDAPSSSTYFAATGKLAQQNASDFSGGLSVGSSYTFGVSGWDATNSVAQAVAAVFDVSSSGVLNNLEEDVNDGGTLTNYTGLAGTYSTFDANGRATYTLTSSGTTVAAGTLYMVSASDLLDLLASSYLTGEMIQQAVPAGGFTNGSFNGNMAFYETELNSGSEGDVSIGLLVADGVSSVAVTGYEDDAGSVSSFTPTCTYSVGANGRVTLTSGGNCGKNPPLFYLAAANTAFMLGTDSGVAFGQVVPQVGGSFSSSSLSGAFFAGDGEVASFALGVEGIGIGVVTLNGSGGYSFIGDNSSTSGQSADQPSSGSIGTVNSNGTFCTSTGTCVDAIIISGTSIVAFDNETSTYPIIQLFQQ